MTVTGGYVRHRDRMIQQSVWNDLQDTLIACRWMVGTTAQQVTDPYDPESGPQILTTVESDVLNLTQGHALTLIDYFPEAEGDNFKTQPNTFAIDNGTQGEASFIELGSTAVQQSYTFTMAFFASSDAVAQAVYNDLRDRYAGRLVRREVIDLWDYNSNSLNPVAKMEIDSFRYSQNTEAITPTEVHLYFGELVVSDFVDP